MPKKSARVTKAVTSNKPHQQLKPVHGMAVGALLVLLKGLLGISILIGLTVFLISAIAHLMALKKAKK